MERTVEIAKINTVSGIDVGNAYVNTKDIKFASRIKVGTLLNMGVQTKEQKEVHQITYNDVDFILGGTEGNAIMGENKFSTDGYKIALLTAIALRSGKRKNVKAKICIGLPLENFDRKAEEVREIIESWGLQSIEVDGKLYNIEIIELIIFIEGALEIKTKNTGHVLTIDIGGGTVNVVEWENGQPIRYKTIDESITNMYSNIAQYINLRYGGGYTTGDVEKFIKDGKKVIKIKQKDVDISEVYKIVEQFVDGVVSKIEEHKFKVNQVEEIDIFGGGVYSTFEYFKKFFPTAIQIDNAQFVNAEIFENIARM